jgi:tripartite-type tricarboxylate transporter receptor subunit TctC
MPKRTWAAGIAGLAAGLSVAAGAFAQSGYPNRTVRIIAGSAPGASIDITSRLAAQWLQTRLKQPFVVENRPGGSGTIATDAVAKSAPDGHTLLVYAHSLATQRLFVKNVPYDWTRDITPIAYIAGSGYAMIISAAIPPRNLAEFVAYAKANPGKLNHGSAGGVEPSMEEVKNRLGVDLTMVGYKGGAPLTAAISAGEVQLMFGGSFQGVQLLQSGKGRVIAYTGLSRHYSLPDVPTLTELGYAMPAAGFWLGLFAPAGLPADITGLLNREVREMNKAPETLERYRAQGYEVHDMSPEQVRQELLDTERRAIAIVQKLGIKPE